MKGRAHRVSALGKTARTREKDINHVLSNKSNVRLRRDEHVSSNDNNLRFKFIKSLIVRLERIVRFFYFKLIYNNY